MDDSRFWELIQRANDSADGDMDEKCAAIESAVAGLSSDDAIAFGRHFDCMMDRCYHWPLWAAAYIIHGGCGDDTFSDFRASLISRGQRAFERAMADPESFADCDDFDEDAWFHEGYQYAVTDGVKAAAGAVPVRAAPYPQQPSGDSWKEDDVYELFPKLRERFAA